MKCTNPESTADLNRLALVAEHRIDELEAALTLARSAAQEVRGRVALLADHHPAWLRCADLESEWDVRNAAHLLSRSPRAA